MALIPAPSLTPALTFLVINQGCKVNQYDATWIEERLAGQGMIPAGDAPPDWIVVNSCAVTHEAEAQARQSVRSLRAAHPDARIVLTGCSAQISPEASAEETGADLVVGNAEKHRVPELIAGYGPDTRREHRGDLFSQRDVPVAGIRSFERRSRAFVKIQDGCDHRCAFCLIPRARGRSRSVADDAVVEEIRRLVAAGHHEAVLTGVHLGDFGKSPGALAALGWRVERETGLHRLRLSSLDPHEFDPALREFAASSRILCDHFHIPLQSGSDPVLARMRREYTAADYAETARWLNAVHPGVAIGTDVIVGFPGETEADFEATMDLIASTPTAFVHVFPYSVRPGTSAAQFDDLLEPAVIHDRASRLARLADGKRARFLTGQVGHTLEVIPHLRPRDGWHRGLSRNGISVEWRCEGTPEPRAPVDVLIEEMAGAALRGVPADGRGAAMP